MAFARWVGAIPTGMPTARPKSAARVSHGCFTNMRSPIRTSIHEKRS